MSNINTSYCRCILNDYYWETALERVKTSPIYEGSHRGKQANEVGFIGEVVAEAWFKLSSISFKDDRNATTHDYTFTNGKTMDVKTKDRTVTPKHNYDNSVPLYNHDHQRPDYYMFISLFRDKSIDEYDIRRFREAYIVGAIDIKTLEDIGQVWKKGQTDPSNGTTFWTDCINIYMSQLTPLHKIKSILETV